MSKGRIMVVEDEAIVALDIKSKLQKMGYEVPATASRGEMAVEKAGELRPDLVLMDVQLAGQMDGIEAARLIRENFSVPVVFLTAYSDENTLQRAQITAPFGYILKPFQDRELHTNIAIALYRHRIEEKLRRLERAVDQSTDGIALVDNDGALLFVNSAWARMHGRSVDEMAGQPISICHTPEQMEMEVQPIVREIEDKGAYQGEIGHLRASGEPFPTWMSVTRLRDAEGASQGFVGIARDISEEKRLELQRAALQQVREEVWRMNSTEDIDKVLVHMRSSLEAMGVPFVGCSLNLVDSSKDPPEVRFHSLSAGGEWQHIREQEAVQAVLSMLNRGQVDYREDLLEEDPHTERERLPHAYASQVRSVLDVPFSRGTLAVNSPEPRAFAERDIAFLCELAAVLDEGFRRVEDIRKLEQRNRELEREVAERRQAEAEKEHLERQLQHSQKMEAVGALTAGIAHNFNNMLGAIMGNLELAMMEADDENQEFLQEAVETCEEAADMVRQLMLFSRKAEIDPKPLDLYNVVEQVAKICRTTFDRKIEIAVRENGSTGTIAGDRGQLYQVFLNLCINARDAMQRYLDSERVPRIVIEVDNAYLSPEDCDENASAKPGEYALIRVCDNGEGMDEITLSRVFEPFFTTKEVGRGTGLGLAMAYGVVQQHGGWIEVQSRADEGTEVSVFLPLVAARTVDREKEDVAAEVRGGKEKILVVDDEENVRTILSMMLSRYGYAVLLGRDGQEGLEIFRQRREEIDLVLLDLSMPRMSGREVLSEIKALDPAARVIVLTGYAEDRIHLDGALEVIHKPFQLKRLAQVVRRALDA